MQLAGTLLCEAVVCVCDRYRVTTAYSAPWPFSAETRKKCKPKLPKSCTDSGNNEYLRAAHASTNPDWFISAVSDSSTTV